MPLPRATSACILSSARREAALVDPNNREELEAWLRTQPREVSIVLAARTALRVLPIVWTARQKDRYADIGADTLLQAFRAIVVA
ncbi:MAG: hypothetical protein ACLQIQ_10480 [Beijerinckiaceae bacterium]